LDGLNLFYINKMWKTYFNYSRVSRTKIEIMNILVIKEIRELKLK